MRWALTASVAGGWAIMRWTRIRGLALSLVEGSVALGLVLGCVRIGLGYDTGTEVDFGAIFA